MGWRAGFTVGFLVLALASVTSCGGDEPGAGGQQARPGGGIGDARIATNDSPAELQRAPGGDGGAAEGAPSLDQLDSSGSAPGAVGSPGTSCSGGGLIPRSSNVGQIARATICLLNVERQSRGLRALRENRQLALAALDHARSMVRKVYFAHDSPDGGSFSDRIKAKGYMSGRTGWTVGENLAWGGGSSGSPGSIVAAWMKSPPHRANILNRRFRDIGLALVIGAPVRGSSSATAATYGSEFGVRAG